MKSVYLAGPLTGLGYKECNDWREYAKLKLAEWHIEGVSPLRGKEDLSLLETIPDECDTIFSCQRGVVTRDRFDVASCDIMLVNLSGAKKVSIGTMIEYGWADSARKPIIAVMEKEGNLHDHAMVRELTGFRVETLDEGLYLAQKILTP